MGRLLRLFNRDQKGITGLETAIILIAFVMVASVFSYVVLSAGLFSSQKAKEAIHAGLEEVRSTMELKGDVLAQTDNGTVSNIIFTLGAHPKSEAIDFTDTSAGTNKVVISYSDAFRHLPTMDWTLTKLVTNSTNGTATDNLLDDNELFQINVDMSPVSANATSGQELGPYRTFTLEIKPPKGAILVLERTIPARLDRIVNLR